MKKLMLLFVMLISSIYTYSQTEDIKIKFPKCYEKITELANKECSDNDEIRENYILRQCEAFIQFREKLEDYTKNESVTKLIILVRCLQRWSENPNLNDSSLSGKLEPDTLKKMDLMFSSLNANWEMVMTTFKKQFDYYYIENKKKL